MNVVVTTTINAPTAAIARYDQLEDWHVIVVGDRKTPEYKLKRGRYVSWEEQQKNYSELCGLIGPDSVQRGRMIAFIEAHKAKAEVVASIDDDCFPYENWGQNVRVGKKTDVDRFFTYDVAFDPFYRFNTKIWHRGFPLELLEKRNGTGEVWRQGVVTPLIQADLCDGETDLDAIQRICCRPSFSFPNDLKPYTCSAYCPVNTQNTFISGKHLKDFYANIPFIGRADDIWAGYLFQAEHPGSVIYCAPSTIHNQERSHESIVRDLRDELYSYRNTHRFLEALSSDGAEAAMKEFLPEQSLQAIEIYRSHFQ